MSEGGEGSRRALPNSTGSAVSRSLGTSEGAASASWACGSAAGIGAASADGSEAGSAGSTGTSVAEASMIGGSRRFLTFRERKSFGPRFPFSAIPASFSASRPATPPRRRGAIISAPEPSNRLHHPIRSASASA